MRRRTSRSLRDRAPDIAAAAGLALVGVFAVWLGRRAGLAGATGMGAVLVVTGAAQIPELVRYSPHRWLAQHLGGILMSGTFLHASLASQLGSHFVEGVEGTEIIALGTPVFIVGLLATVATVLYYTQSSRRWAPIQ